MPVELNIVESVTALDTTVVEVILEPASEPGPAGPGVPTGGTAGQVLTKDSGTDFDTSWQDSAGGGGGAPDDVDYLVGTASGDLSAEIVVGTSPGGELGGTWASPTVDATHSGSSHAGVQAAAEATAAAALATHAADTTGVHGITDTSALALSANVQPLDSDLTAIAALTTTAFGRGLLELANQAALLAAAGAAAASHAHSGADITSGTVAEARIHADIARDAEVTSAISALSTVYQALDSDLTAIAALTTTSFGRSLLAMADAAAVRAALDLEAGTDFPALATFNDHSARHENGGADEISIAGLDGTPVELTNHLNDTSAAHAASAVAFTPAGTIAATDVQAAIEEVAAEAGGGGVPSVEWETRSSNTILGTADKGKSIDITATITQTLTAAATLGDGWWVTLRNATDDGTTVVTLDPNNSETIDGIAQPKMYSGETRIVICDGTNFHSTLVAGGFAKFTANGSFRLPYGATLLSLDLVGPGGGGGGGRGGSAGSIRGGASGGGGGARTQKVVSVDLIGAAGDDITVVVPAGGAFGAGGSAANGSDGTAGAATTFDTTITAGGGGGGRLGDNGAQFKSGGGGGGAGEVGQSGQTNANSRGGMGVTSSVGAAGNPGVGQVGAGSGNAAATTNPPAEWGGGCGGYANGNGDNVGQTGGRSLHGGGGGAGGGGITTGNAQSGGSVGGDSGTWSTTGGSGGAAGASSGGAGTAGADGDSGSSGEGGGGGGANSGGTGGAGGNGGVPGGGGGGGGAGTTVGGAGGTGGRGECRVWYQ